jgi:hypothetical protein
LPLPMHYRRSRISRTFFTWLSWFAPFRGHNQQVRSCAHCHLSNATLYSSPYRTFSLRRTVRRRILGVVA